MWNTFPISCWIFCRLPFNVTQMKWFLRMCFFKNFIAVFEFTFGQESIVNLLKIIHWFIRNLMSQWIYIWERNNNKRQKMARRNKKKWNIFCKNDSDWFHWNFHVTQSFINRNQIKISRLNSYQFINITCSFPEKKIISWKKLKK